MLSSAWTFSTFPLFQVLYIRLKEQHDSYISSATKKHPKDGHKCGNLSPKDVTNQTWAGCFTRTEEQSVRGNRQAEPRMPPTSYVMIYIPGIQRFSWNRAPELNSSPRTKFRRLPRIHWLLDTSNNLKSIFFPPHHLKELSQKNVGYNDTNNHLTSSHIILPNPNVSSNHWHQEAQDDASQGPCHEGNGKAQPRRHGRVVEEVHLELVAAIVTVCWLVGLAVYT